VPVLRGRGQGQWIGAATSLAPSSISPLRSAYLDDHRRGGLPGSTGAWAVQPAVRHAEVVLGVSEVELVHGRHEPSRAGGSVEQDRQLLGDLGVLQVRRRDPVQDTVPDLVEAVQSRPMATLQKRAYLVRQRIENKLGDEQGGSDPRFGRCERPHGMPPRRGRPR